jgi:hypothetical protein
MIPPSARRTAQNRKISPGTRSEFRATNLPAPAGRQSRLTGTAHPLRLLQAKAEERRLAMTLTRPHTSRTLLFLLALLSVAIRPVFGQNSDTGSQDGEEFVHPFLAHMGMPDEPGEVSLRTTALQSQYAGETESDLSFHVEAGLVKNLGLHVRADGINHEPYSEVMLQYGLYTGPQSRYGFSVFGQISVPTGPVDNNEYKGLFGGSYMFMPTDYLLINGNVHYNPKDDMAEYEDAFVFRQNATFFPVAEVRGEITTDYVTSYILPGIKFRISDAMAFGVGAQIALTDHREYDTEALFTFEFVNY